MLKRENKEEFNEQTKTVIYEQFLRMYSEILPGEYDLDECRELLNQVRESSKSLLAKLAS